MTSTEEDPFACFDESDNDDEPCTEVLQATGDTAGEVAKTKDPRASSFAKPTTSQRDPNCGVLSFHPNTEQSLLIHVQNDLSDRILMNEIQAAEAVLRSIDDFCSRRHWMMHVGPQKGEIVTSFLSKCLQSVDPGAEPFVCVEIGTYCGYASILLAQKALKTLGTCMKRFHLYTVEVNASNVAVAKKLIQLANMQDWITVILFQPEKENLVKVLRDAIDQEGPCSSNIDFLFLDHDKDLYLSDLQHLERSGMIQQGTHVAADNVIFAQINEYREHMNKLVQCGIVQTSLVESQLEYSEPEQSKSMHADDQDMFHDGVGKFKDLVSLSCVLLWCDVVSSKKPAH